MKSFSFKRLPLQRRLFFYTSAVIAFVLVVALLACGTIISGIIHNKAAVNAQRELNLIKNNIQGRLDAVKDYAVTLSVNQNILDILAQNPSKPSDATKLYNLKTALLRHLTLLGGTRDSFSSVDILFLDHTLAHINEYNPTAAQQVIDFDAVQRTTENRRVAWSGPHTVKTTAGQDELVFCVYKSVSNMSRNDCLGYLVIYVREALFSEILEVADNGATKFYVLQNDIVISSTNAEDKGVPFGQLIQNQENVVKKEGIVQCEDGDLMMYSCKLEEVNWEIVAATPTRYLNAEINSFAFVLCMVGAVALVIASVLSGALSHSILQPLERLLGSIKNIPVTHGVQLLDTADAADDNAVSKQTLDFMLEKIEFVISKIYQDQKNINDLKLKIFQAQIQPHFLYNALEAAMSLISLGLSDDAIVYLRHLASFFRHSLSSGKDIISLEEEMELTENYLEIQKLRYCEFFDYTIDFDSAAGMYLVPKLLLQPLVENAIYHGIKVKGVKSEIKLSCRKIEQGIVMEVTDTGVGMTPEQIEQLLHCESVSDAKNGSYGFANLRERLRVAYDGRARVAIASVVGQYTTIKLILPFGGTT